MKAKTVNIEITDQQGQALVELGDSDGWLDYQVDTNTDKETLVLRDSTTDFVMINFTLKNKGEK